MKLGWSINDPRFDELNEFQWRFYSEMYFAQKDDLIESNLNLVEYGASFWNPEGVKQMKKTRELYKENSFMSDEEFEKSLKQSKYKEIFEKYVGQLPEGKPDTNSSGSVGSQEKGERAPDFDRISDILKGKF